VAPAAAAATTTTTITTSTTYVSAAATRARRHLPLLLGVPCAAVGRVHLAPPVALALGLHLEPQLLLLLAPMHVLLLALLEQRGVGLGAAVRLLARGVLAPYRLEAHGQLGIGELFLWDCVSRIAYI
jgi:hypothetical protein